MCEALIIGKNLKDLRQQAGLSRRRIARYLGVSIQQVSKYESGLNRLPIEKLFWLQKLFAVPYEYFFAGIERNGESDGVADLVKQEISMKLEKITSHDLCTRIRDIVIVLTR